MPQRLSPLEYRGGDGGSQEPSRRDPERRLQEFALNVLSVTPNHRLADLYLRYFPEGYGRAIRVSSRALLAFAEVVLGKLREESGP